MGLKVLLVGGGGREHALAWKIAQSPLCEHLYIAPGNPMIDKLGTCVDIPVTDITALKYFVKKEDIDLTVVGPEAPLVAGIVDSFKKSGLKIFGPSKAAAQIEGSKTFSKNLMRKYHIPTADYRTAHSMEDASAVLKTMNVPVVIKADGLAEGKGAFVCMEEEDVEQALRSIFSEKRFGEAGMSCVIEEFMEGEEASLFAFTDGYTIVPLLAAQDHKPLLDGDEGPNTGGMGSYAPAPVMSEAMTEKVLKEIIVPTVHAMNKEGCTYKGLLYTGLMICGDQPKVVEFNCRFGDPETQPLMVLLKTDILPIMQQIAEGNIEESHTGLEWHEGAAIGVVMASGGYPGQYKKGLKISGLEELSDDVIPFAAGVKQSGDAIVTNGGRVLCITARGESLHDARDLVYREIEKVSFSEAFYRKDIGHRALT